MFHVKILSGEETISLVRECKREILRRAPDAGKILQFLTAREITVKFAQPAGLSRIFQDESDAGSVSVFEKCITLDGRKPIAALAGDLACYARILMRAPEPNAFERLLFERLGITFGRFMKLEQGFQ